MSTNQLSITAFRHIAKQKQRSARVNVKHGTRQIKALRTGTQHQQVQGYRDSDRRARSHQLRLIPGSISNFKTNGYKVITEPECIGPFVYGRQESTLKTAVRLSTKELKWELLLVRQFSTRPIGFGKNGCIMQ